MARKKRRPKVFYNSSTDTWSNDSMTEPYLMPGTEAYKAYQESLKQQFGDDGKQSDDFHEEYAEETGEYRENQLDKEKDDDAAHHVATRKFRHKRSKERQDKEIQQIVDNGLGKHVDITGGLSSEYGLPGISNSDELEDDGITADDYKKEVIKDYKKHYDAVVREVPSVNKNADGEVSEEEILTPGAKAMKKYM